MLSRLRCGVTRGALSVQTLCTKRLITQSSLTVLYRNKIPTASMKPVQTSYLHARSFNACTRLRQSDYVQKGNEHIEAGRAKEAIECYVDAVAEGGESADLLYNLGNAYCQAGRVMDAMVSFRKSLEMDPEQPDVLVNLANLYASEGNHRDAIKLYQEALELRPEDAQCLHNLGLSYSKNGDWGMAVASLKKSMELDPNLSVEPLKYALIRMIGGTAQSG